MQVEDLPPHKQFWERPTRSPKGDESSCTIYMAVGITLSKWEVLETYFATTFQYLVESKSNAALRAYGAMASAKARRDALDAAAEAFFYLHQVPKVESDRFNKLMNHFYLASSRRNEIAHGVLAAVTDIGCYLTPPDYNTNKTKIEKEIWEGDIFAALGLDYAYTSNDINHFKDRFTVLGNASLEYLVELQKQYPAPR